MLTKKNNDIVNKYVIGSKFETNLVNNLNVFRPKDSYLLRNINLYSERLKKYIEIDILLITTNGIYCIESKFVSSSIVGDMKDRMWFVYNAYGSNRIYNPYIQNTEHLRCLKQYLRKGGYSTNNIQNVIVVPDKAEINTDCSLVRRSKDWLFSIAKDLVVKENKIDVDRVYRILEEFEVI